MRTLILLLVLLPGVLLGQPTGKYRTVKQSFNTIYTPKTYHGYVTQMEVYVTAQDTMTRIWFDLYYTKKTLFSKKKYNLWEIYRPRL